MHCITSSKSGALRGTAESLAVPIESMRLLSSSSSSSVDQLDAGHRPLCPIHYLDPFLNQIKIKKISPVGD